MNQTKPLTQATGRWSQLCRCAIVGFSEYCSTADDGGYVSRLEDAYVRSVEILEKTTVLFFQTVHLFERRTPDPHIHAQ